MITAPGIYPEISSAEYFADPCPAPSLTQSVAKILLERSPLHAWHAHPRLNPDYRQDDDTKFDLGNVAHKLMLGRGKDLAVFDAPDWNATGMGKGAKSKLHEDRDAARAEGKVAVLGKTVAKAGRMVKAAREQLDLRNLTYTFSDGGQAEVCIAWQEGETWFRQLVDWISIRNASAIVADYKTTDMSVAPPGLGRQMFTAGWPIQAAMTDRALDALAPETAGKRDFLFVVQETDPPYCLNVVLISEAVLSLGRKRLEIGAGIWRDCIAADRWPGYPAEIVQPELPGWAEQQWLDREIHEASRERVPHDILMAG